MQWGPCLSGPLNSPLWHFIMRSNWQHTLILLLGALLFIQCVPPRPGTGRVPADDLPLAFPGAEGYGMHTTGGRGGKVLIVDKLDDQLKDPLPGTLRWAVKQTGPRVIVFQVSGTIALEGPLDIRKGDLTIAGQTAPGDGICIKNFVTSIEADNVIIRYIRFRCGDERLTNSAQDALNGTRRKNIIIDHCSMSWSIDETASFYDNENFTMQWCIISESLYRSGHQKGNHGFGGIWGGKGASFHHNLLAHHTSRNPRFNGSRFSRDSAREVVDFRNNVIFNWGFNSAYGGEEGKQNIVNNYYKPGPATRKGEVQYRILDLTQVFFDTNINPDTVRAGKFFIDGNMVHGNVNATKDNWAYGVQKSTEQEKQRSRVYKPFAFAAVTTQTAQQAYEDVLLSAGAALPHRDIVDSRIVAEVRSGNCTFGGAFGTGSGIIDTQKTVGGWPELKTYGIKQDSDADGMPDDWEKAMKLDPTNASDAVKTGLHAYYTNIEMYINSLVR